MTNSYCDTTLIIPSQQNGNKSLTLGFFLMLALFWIYVRALKLVTRTCKALQKKGKEKKRKKKDKDVNVNVKIHQAPT